MSSFIPSQELIAKAFAIAGLALVAPSTYYFRNYNRVLDYAQLFYIFALTYAASTNTFSLNLGWVFLPWMPSFMGSYSKTGEYLNTYGYLISPGIAWLGVALLMLIIIKIVACKKKGLHFQGFYNFWKGLMRWFAVPLVYYSTQLIITNISANKIMDVNFLPPAGTCLFLFIWMFVELIGHKCVQREEENNWKKWCDFFSSFRIYGVVALVVVGSQSNVIGRYFAYGSIFIYDLVFLLKYKFTFRVCERVIFIIEEGILITIFSLFMFNSKYIFDYNLDLIGLALVIFFELIMFVPKLISYCKSDEDQSDP